MIHFSTTCIDDFFDYPDVIRNYATSLEYKPSLTGQWPGERTELLEKLNPLLHSNICTRYLLNHYKYNDLIKFNATAYFQKISSKFSKGCIHTDYPNYHTVIIYLTPNASLDSGTSLYRPKKVTMKSINKLKQKFNLGAIDNEKIEKYREEFNNNREEFNSNFEETDRFNNLYNRCIGFDASIWHGANNLQSNDERLTLIIFFNSIIGEMTGLQRSQAVPTDGMEDAHPKS